ncbi:NADH dehydrogenase [ubiquinone] 1 alpha subcomplex assembly factor 2-like [Lineus longissimus]|uniref:NADH dehydrogenase [ubiquinone] 1 alpha subcomplex assembly factor 2-like n=1 Tax=Lineus longissimus TaxID=88925 RepID=UPI002B4D62D6
MSRRPGYFGQFLQRIKKSFVIYRTSEKYVGEDHLGNKYFEIQKDEKSGVKAKRSYKAHTEDPTAVGDIPTEWDSWLRWRRNDPPMQEEIDKNYAMMMARQARAQEQDMKDKLEAEENYEAGTVHRVEAYQDKSKFPTYSDYEQVPGVEPKTKEDR